MLRLGLPSRLTLWKRLNRASCSLEAAAELAVAAERAQPVLARRPVPLRAPAEPVRYTDFKNRLRNR